MHDTFSFTIGKALPLHNEPSHVIHSCFALSDSLKSASAHSLLSTPHSHLELQQFNGARNAWPWLPSWSCHPACDLPEAARAACTEGCRSPQQTCGSCRCHLLPCGCCLHIMKGDRGKGGRQCDEEVWKADGLCPAFLHHSRVSAGPAEVAKLRTPARHMTVLPMNTE